MVGAFVCYPVISCNILVMPKKSKYQMSLGKKGWGGGWGDVLNKLAKTDVPYSLVFVTKKTFSVRVNSSYLEFYRFI